MADSSSISNSDPAKPIHFGVPWGLIGAAVLLIAVELTLRGIGRMNLIAFASDEGQYHAVRDTIDAQGPAEVALVGSSQLREGISMPVLLPELQRLAGRPVWAANYSMRGARVDVMDAAVRYLKRQPNPPKLFVVGVSARDIRAEAPDWPRLAIFWSPGDWWAEFKTHREAAMGVLPVVVRSEVGRAVWSLRYREEISLWLQRRFARFGVDASEERNPILGEATAQHIGRRGIASYKTSGIPLHRLFDYARGSYLLERPPRAPKEMLKRLDSFAANFKTAHPRSLWVEMPMADPMEKWLEKIGQKAVFDSSVLRAIQGTKIDFFPMTAEKVDLGDEDFRDLQHLNRVGAEQFSKWLAKQLGNIMQSHETAENN